MRTKAVGGAVNGSTHRDGGAPPTRKTLDVVRVCSIRFGSSLRRPTSSIATQSRTNRAVHLSAQNTITRGPRGNGFPPPLRVGVWPGWARHTGRSAGRDRLLASRFGPRTVSVSGLGNHAGPRPAGFRGCAHGVAPPKCASLF
eukprot:7389482-Prymnesium_polylepis.1